MDRDFIQQLRPAIEDALHAKFFSDEKAAAKYMAEDPQIVVEREDLEARSARLLEIESRLDISIVEV